MARQSRLLKEPVFAPAPEIKEPGSQAPDPATQAPKPKPKPTRVEATKSSLLEPHELIWFHPGKPKEVARITKWMQAQINAGLLKVT
jgi:hypothetical protein